MPHRRIRVSSEVTTVSPSETRLSLKGVAPLGRSAKAADENANHSNRSFLKTFSQQAYGAKTTLVVLFFFTETLDQSDPPFTLPSIKVKRGSGVELPAWPYSSLVKPILKLLDMENLYFLCSPALTDTSLV